MTVQGSDLLEACLSVTGALRMLASARADGACLVRAAGREASFFFCAGELVGAHIPFGTGVGQRLVEQGLARETLDRALAVQRRKRVREPIGQILSDLGLVAEEQVREALIAHLVTVFEECLRWGEGVVSFDARPVRDHRLNPEVSIDDLVRRATGTGGES